MFPHRGRFQRLSAPASTAALEVSPSQIRYEEEPPAVARVLIHIDYTDGSACEWEAAEPQGFTLTEGMATRQTDLSIGGEDNAAPVFHASPALSLRFTAHQRHNLHKRAHGPWRVLSAQAHDALASFLAAMGYE